MNSYRGDLGPVGESGQEYTHLASLVVEPGAAPIRAYVKVYAPSYSGRQSRGLVNELVGYFCGECAGLPVPPRAGLIALDVASLASPPHWLASSPQAIGWWTEDVAQPSLRAIWNFDALPAGSTAQNAALATAREFLLKHSGTPGVIAFDDLIANIDRNLGNLLRGPTALTLIDHGQTLTGPVWLDVDLVPTATYTNKVLNLLGAAASTLPYKNAVMSEYHSIVSTVSPRLGDLKSLLDGVLTPPDSTAAHDFLSQRCVPPSIAHRVGVVV